MLGVRYVPFPPLSDAACAGALGVVGFGLPGSPAAAQLAVLDGGPLLEIWTSDRPIERVPAGRIDSAHDGEVLFGVLTIDEGPGRPLEAATDAAYVELFGHIEAAGYPHLIRVYHYLPRITQDEAGLERYRRFNVGRHEAFVARGRDPARSPAASALGAQGGMALVYFIAARRPAMAIENPRQVSAFRYPPRHGPRSPTFTRAAVASHGGQRVLFLSGTASIVGHESKHPGDVAAQTREMIANIQALFEACAATAAPVAPDSLRLKAYVRHPEHWPVVRGILSAHLPSAQVVALQADICRPELLVEVDGLGALAG
jgi:enamine deaminase RidA (YjgF/YER057c/UK114 family)